MQSICASHTSCAACVPCKAGAQFTCFTSIQVRILTRACRTELPLDLRCSVYWLYWYKGTNTDARLQSSTAARPLRAPALHCLGFFLFFLSSLPFFSFSFFLLSTSTRACSSLSRSPAQVLITLLALLVQKYKYRRYSWLLQLRP